MSLKGVSLLSLNSEVTFCFKKLSYDRMIFVSD